MARSSSTVSSSTDKVKNLGSNDVFIDKNAPSDFYVYEGFPMVRINNAFIKPSNADYYCTDVNSITRLISNVYGNYDDWNEVYRGSPFTYEDLNAVGGNTIGRANPTFVQSGTRPSFSNILYSNLPGFGTNTYDLESVVVSRTGSKLKIVATRTNSGGEITVEKVASDFPDKVVPKRLLIEIQGSGGGGGKGGTGVNVSTGNGGGAGGYWCGIIDVDNVYSWEISMGAHGHAGTNSGDGGSSGGDTIVYYYKNASSSMVGCVRVKGGSGANSAGSTAQASGGGVIDYSSSYHYTLLTATGGKGGVDGTSADGTSKIYPRCTRTNGTFDEPIQVTRGDKRGGSNSQGGTGGGASYFANGGEGGHFTSGGQVVGDAFYGAGGGGSAYDFWDSPRAGVGGQSGIIIWY